MTKIDNMNEQIGFTHFFERRFKRFDQRMGKFSQETDRIGEKYTLFVRQNETSRSRVERGEKFVFGNDIRAGEQIQQGRLASIRIPYHCGDGPLMTFTAFTLYCTCFAHRFELSLQPRNSFLHAAAINSQLCFAWSTRADPTSLSSQVM